MRILCINILMVKFFKCYSFDQNPCFKISFVETSASLAFELEAVLVECPPNVLVSMPNRFKTIIIHLDIAGVETGPCGFTKLNRSCEFCPRISFVLSKYESIHWPTHQALILLKNMKLDRISRFRSLGCFCILSKMKGITR